MKIHALTTKIRAKKPKASATAKVRLMQALSRFLPAHGVAPRTWETAQGQKVRIAGSKIYAVAAASILVTCRFSYTCTDSDLECSVRKDRFK